MIAKDFVFRFDTQEKIAFLERNGWKVKRIPITKSINIYQNRFVDEVTIESTAEKDGEKLDMDYAFRKVLKQKILEL